MLSSEYNYVSIDFETTGLSTESDEILQVGIVRFDHTYTLIDTYVSLVKPSDESVVSGMVGYITGLKDEDFKTAPTVKDIDQKVRSFFDEKTIVIGHNVGFDVAFLQRFFPGVQYASTIDTYQRSQVFLHFVPSFALEVLCEYLQDKPKFVEYITAMGIEPNTQSYHDALYDAQSAAALFSYLSDYASTLLGKYPQISYILQKSENILFYDLISDADSITGAKNISIPLLRKSITTPQTMVKAASTPDLGQYPTGTQLYIGNKTPKDIATLIAQHKNIICVFSHKSKADIVKHMLHDMSVFGIASLYEESFFDQKRFDVFMQKKSFTTQEVNFMCKHISHYEQGLGILDIQSDDEKKIVYFLQEKKKANKAPIVFATHNVLYQQLQKNADLYKDYTIYFFDQDWRYISYNDFASNAYNPLYFLELVEKIVYTYDICYQAQPDKYEKKYAIISNFYAFLQIFIGVLSIETKKVFTDYNGSSIQLDPLLRHHHFYQTQQLWDKVLHWSNILKETLPANVYEDIGIYIDQFEHILSSMITVDKCMYNQSAFYFVYKETNRYTQRNEFSDVFASQRILFFSHYNKQNRLLEDNGTNKMIPLHRLSQSNILDQLTKHMQHSKKIFILSTQKAASQNLFATICNDGIHKDYTVLAENITGGYGKNIFLAQQQEKVIMIGGYSFLLQCLAKRLYFDTTVVFFIKGSMEKLLLCDIQWYANRE